MAIVSSRSASDGEFDCTVRTGVLELGDNVEVWRGEKLLLNWAVVETLFVGGFGATMARPKASCSISLNEPYEAEADDILFAYGSA